MVLSYDTKEERETLMSAAESIFGYAGGLTSSTKVKAMCKEWLEETFGICPREIMDFKVCEKNRADMIFGITTVGFSFEASSGEIMESAAFLKDGGIL